MQFKSIFTVPSSAKNPEKKVSCEAQIAHGFHTYFTLFFSVSKRLPFYDLIGPIQTQTFLKGEKQFQIHMKREIFFGKKNCSGGISAKNAILQIFINFLAKIEKKKINKSDIEEILTP